MSNNNQAKPAAQIKNSSSTSNWLVGLISFVAIFSAGGGIGLGYYAWLELNKRLDIAAVDRQSISHDIETIDENSRLQSFKSQIQHNIEEFEPQLIELSKQIEQQAVLQEKFSESTLETIAYVNRSQLNWGLRKVWHSSMVPNSQQPSLLRSSLRFGAQHEARSSPVL